MTARSNQILFQVTCPCCQEPASAYLGEAKSKKGLYLRCPECRVFVFGAGVIGYLQRIMGQYDAYRDIKDGVWSKEQMELYLQNFPARKNSR